VCAYVCLQSAARAAPLRTGRALGRGFTKEGGAQQVCLGAPPGGCGPCREPQGAPGSAAGFSVRRPQGKTMECNDRPFKLTQCAPLPLLHRPGRVCDGSPASTMECAPGKVIHVTSGRDIPTVCEGHSGDCSAVNVSAQVQAACESRSSCYVSPELLRGLDPCYGVRKYLEFSYTCVDDPAGGSLMRRGWPGPVVRSLRAQLSDWCA
jgi:hypothetical protein